MVGNHQRRSYEPKKEGLTGTNPGGLPYKKEGQKGVPVGNFKKNTPKGHTNYKTAYYFP